MEVNVLCFSARDLFLRLDVNHIAYVEAMGNYVKIVMLNGLKVAVRRTMSEMMNDFQKQSACIFVRAGKSFIINLSHVFLIDSVHSTLILSDGSTFVCKKVLPKVVLKEIRKNLFDYSDKIL